MFVPNLSEAAAVRLIETILFGRPLEIPAPAPTIRRRPRRSLAPHPLPLTPSRLPMLTFSAASCFISTLSRRLAPRSHPSPLPPPPRRPVLPSRQAAFSALLGPLFLGAFVIWLPSPRATAVPPCCHWVATSSSSRY